MRNNTLAANLTWDHLEYHYRTEMNGPNGSQPDSNPNSSFGFEERNQTQDSRAERIGKIIAFSLILIVALIGNVLIIIVVRRNANMRKTINYFIVNMAVSDLFIPLIVLPRLIVQIMMSSDTWRVHGLPGEILCKLVPFFSDLSPVVSIFSVICITLDRFCAVVFPMRRSLITTRVRCILITLTWLFSAAFFLPYFYAFKLKTFRSGQFCLLRWSDSIARHVTIHRAFATTACVFFSLIPIVIITFMYATILIVTRAASVARQNQQSNTALQLRQSNNNKLLRLAILTVASFAICWGPYNVYLFAQNFLWNWDPPFNSDTYRVFDFVVMFLTHAYSAINPCLFFVFVENYRRGLKRFLAGASSKSNKREMRSKATRFVRETAKSGENTQGSDEDTNPSSTLLTLHPLQTRLKTENTAQD